MQLIVRRNTTMTAYAFVAHWAVRDVNFSFAVAKTACSKYGR